MANVPNIRSKEQIAGELIDSIRARLRKDIDLNDGSTLTQFIEAITQGIFKGEADRIAMIDADSIDRAEGEALQRLARDRNVPILPALPSNGRVNISDATFEKISTRVYAGQPAPVAGSIKVYVADASKMPSAGGRIYLGRGTTNVEGPLVYISTQAEAGGAYWSITLAGTSPTTKFHNIGETVVLAQGGNRFIPSNTTVQTAQGASLTAVAFVTTSAATIIDGEVIVSDVPVRAQTSGSIGNVSRGAIKEIVGVPFAGTVFNEFAFSNGRDADTEDDIRERIKGYEQAKSKGTEQAIRFAANGVVAKDELKKVTSANVVRYADNSTELVFDDGSGYEPNFVGAPFETIVDSAVGGEKEIQLRQRPIAQARIKNATKGPYPLVDGSFLAVEIDGVETVHQFNAADFKVPSSATSFEVASSINGNSLLNFLASTNSNGENLVLYPKDRNSNNIVMKEPVSGTDANLALGFPLNSTVTIRLYKNDLPLYQDGIIAKVTSRAKSSWSPAISAGDDLQYSVDGTPTITTVFNLTDFQEIDPGATVSALTSLEIWVEVFNNLMSGVIASIVGDNVVFQSARGDSDDASIEIIGGTLKNQIFQPDAVLKSQGQSADFTLNKQTGQIALKDALVIGDKVTGGSLYTRGNTLTIATPNGPGSAGRLWVITDGDALSIPNGLKSNTTVQFQKTGTLLTITGQSPSLTPEGFEEAAPGDWIIVWANPTDPAALQSNQGFWRIQSVQAGQVVVDDGTTVRSNLGIGFIPITDRIAIVRSDAPVQMLDFVANPLVTFLNELKTELTGVDAEIVGSRIRISTKTFSEDGQIYFAAADAGGQTLGLPLATPLSNTPSHYGFVAETDAEVGVPSFSHGTLGPAVSDSNFDLTNYEELHGEKDAFVEILEKYDASGPSIVPESNKSRRAFVTDYDASISRLFLMPPLYMLSGQSLMQEDDRFMFRSSYKFDSRDSTAAVVDGDSETKSFTMPVSRKVIVSNNSTPTTQDFSASDGESTLDMDDPASFYDFQFANFRIHRQARTHLTNGVYDLLLKNSDYGPSGNRVRVGLLYPESVQSLAISHRYDFSEVNDAKIFLPVKDVRVPNWDYTTAFTVSKTTLGGKDTITFTWQSGLEPDFSNAGADVHVGDVVFISSDADFLSANSNFRARVISVTPTSFTVETPTGAYVNDAVTFDNIINQAGTITITTNVPHQLITGQRIGIYNTASNDGGLTFPFNASYTVTVLNATQFTVATPVSVPGGLIQSATHISNVITVTTPVAHGLNLDSIILISGAGSPYDGLAAVSNVLSPNQFQYIKAGASSPIAAGRFDFQSYLPGTVSNISTATKAGSLVTANTSAPHLLSPGNIVNVAGILIDPWSNATTYGVGDMIRYSGQNYLSLQAGNLNNQPDIQPTFWQPTSLDLGGTFIVNSTPTGSQFTYFYSQTGNAAGTAGTATEYDPTGSMARAISGSTNENLQFASVETTAQEIADYAASNMAERTLATVDNGNPSAVINMSTEDEDLGSNYIQTSVTSLHTLLTNRRAKLRTAAVLPKGSRTTLASMTGGASIYNGEYIILDTYLDTGLGFIVSEIQLPTLAIATATLTPGGTATGSTPMLMMEDGDNSVQLSDLDALIASPMFTMKEQWASAPEIDEELRLVACTNEQLVRFWNKLVVTGFTNVGKVDLSRYGREIQLSTKTFGNLGSVQVAGGSANNLNLQVVGAAGTLSDKLGSLTVPYEIRKGLVRGQWIEINNTVRQNKEISFDPTTAIKLWGDGAEITAGAGSFQTARAVTHTATTKLKIEKHGQFLAIIGIGGPSMALITNGIQEGDWLRLNNIAAANWAIGTTYAINQRVAFGGRNYTSLQNSNLANQPDTSPAYWQIQEFDKANQGIFQVVRIFGQDSLWIEHADAVEEIITLGNANNMRFYSYDSAMPGDTLVITTDVLGAQNVGRYTLVDESFGPGYSFPIANRIWTTVIPSPIASGVVLGGEYAQVNVEEEEPTHLWKKIFANGPGAGSLMNIVVDSPNLMNKITSSLGAQVTGTGKLGFNEQINFGIDAYRYYIGLIRELNKRIYGDPADPTNYPGVRAAGTAIGIKEAILRRIKASFSIRIKSGVPFTEIRERVKSAVAGYVNNLDVGESVSISRMIAAANTVPGVVSVAITFPAYSSAQDLITVATNEKAFVVDPTVDITISVIAG
jgi:baseplate J-like protein